jgi:putative flavoprotein involved in K+ transport
VGARDGLPLLEDGRVVDVANVVWCTGFRNDYGWIGLPLPLDADGFPEQHRGAVPSAPGLYFVGLPFLHSFASMLIIGAGRDGKSVAKHILARRSSDRSEGRGSRGQASAGQEVAA